VAEFRYLKSNKCQEKTHANAAALPAEYMVSFVIIISLTADALHPGQITQPSLLI